MMMPRVKLIREGRYLAEVDVEFIMPEDVGIDAGWSPYLSLHDAYKLDDVRQALRRGDIETASRLGRIYKLTPITT